ISVRAVRNHDYGLLLTVISVFSHFVKLPTKVFELVKTALQKYGVAAVLEISTTNAVLCVSKNDPEATLVSVIGWMPGVTVSPSSVKTTVPVHEPWRNVITSDPLNAVPPVDETVTRSFGSHFCSDVADVVSVIVKHSVCVPSAVPV